MFLNISNHHSQHWSEEQRSAAEAMGRIIVDMPFPNVPPDADRSCVQEMAEDMLADILGKSPTAVHVMGEHTLNVALVVRLKSMGVKTVASTTERDVDVASDGTKTSRFRFVRFWEY